jgi:hypothetical protein
MISPIKFVFTTMLLFVSLSLALVCGSRVVRFFFLTDNFIVSEFHSVCEMPLNNRCVTHYTIVRKDDLRGDFVPFGTEFEPDRLGPGVTFLKDEYGFLYKINNVSERWPYLKSQIILCLSGFLGLIFWYVLGGVGVSQDWLKRFIARFHGA